MAPCLLSRSLHRLSVCCPQLHFQLGTACAAQHSIHMYGSCMAIACLLRQWNVRVAQLARGG